MKMIYEKIQSGMDVDVPDLEVRRKKTASVSDDWDLILLDQIGWSLVTTWDG